MEVIDTCDALPCNAEVLQFLRETRGKLATKRAKDSSGQAKAATVVLETLNYLEKTPAATLSKNIETEKLNEFFDAIEKFNLKPPEKLQLLNHCPKSAVEIQLLVEDSEERLSESDVDEILNFVKIHLLGETEDDAEESEPPEDSEEQSSQ